MRWALEGLVVQHLTVARIAEVLAVSWDTANSAVLAEAKQVLIGVLEGHAVQHLVARVQDQDLPSHRHHLLRLSW